MFLLAISGIVTAVPLLCFSEAVKRAPLNLIGFIQYLNPTIQMLVAILIFGETVSFGELKGFLFIWVAILVFVTGQILNLRKSSWYLSGTFYDIILKTDQVFLTILEL